MAQSQIKILIVDDDEIVRDSLSAWFKEDGYNVDSCENANEALKKISITNYDIYFLDIKMPGMDGIELHKRIKNIYPDALVMIITAYASVDTAVKALKDGAFDYITKPFDPDYLSHVVKNAVKQKILTDENLRLKESLQSALPVPEIIGSSRKMYEIKESIKTVAPTNTTVMIRGESGTGKELVAQSIHLQSERKYSQMVSVNCGAFSESLLESELFGHEKGAFTGALYRRKGKLELADGGTLFLDEIGAIHPKTQVELLRVIETKEFTRVGGTEAIKTDFRIICATNSNLEEDVREGRFREDLYYRLRVYLIELPSLRERISDIPELTQYFIDKYRRKMNKPIEGITQEALDLLMRKNWPGNVRELENAIERAMVVSTGRELTKDNFYFQKDEESQISSGLTLADIEKQHIVNVLKENDWNISLAAKILGVDRTTIYHKLKAYGIERP